MKTKNSLKEFIKTETDIEISKLLQKYITNSSLVNTANKQTLKCLVEEFEPIYQHYKLTIDGCMEIQKIMVFSMFLKSRIERIPELQHYLK
ncbi:MAG: hypothetical protein ACI4M3_04360 [Acutalibacteraceae bacterium]